MYETIQHITIACYAVVEIFNQNKLIPLGIDFGQEIYPRHSKSVSIHLIWKDQIQ